MDVAFLLTNTPGRSSLADMDDALRSEIRDGLPVFVCIDCRAWCRPHERMRHSKRCDHRDAQPRRTQETKPKVNTSLESGVFGTRASVRRLRALARDGRVGDSGLSEQEICDAVHAGAISMSDAMNRDY